MNNAVLIQIKEATKNKPRRLVATLIDDNRILNGGKITEAFIIDVLREEFLMPSVQRLVTHLLHTHGFAHLSPRIAKLPNGDWCATLIEQPRPLGDILGDCQ